RRDCHRDLIGSKRTSPYKHSTIFELTPTRAHLYQGLDWSPTGRPRFTSDESCRKNMHCASTGNYTSSLATPSKYARHFYLREGSIGLLLRASNEGFPKPRVARAQGINEPPLPPSRQDPLGRIITVPCSTSISVVRG